MFYEKTYRMKKPERKRVPLSNFAGYDENKISRTLPCDYVGRVYNFGFDNNKLVDPYGVSEFVIGGYAFPAPPKVQGKKGIFCATMRVDDAARFAIMISHSGGAELCVEGDTQWRHLDTAGGYSCSAIYYVTNEPCLFIGGENGIKWFVDNGFTAALNKPVTDMCVHYERMFAIVKGTPNSVWFSKSGNALVWEHAIDKGGYIDFDGTLGEVNAIKSFNNYLYIFCDYGIYRLTAYGDQSQFNLKKIYTASGRIFAPSVTVCGEYIAFAGEDGIFLFDGYDVSRYTGKVNKLISSGLEDLSACYWRNKYFLSFTDRSAADFGVYDKELSNNTLLILDMTDKSVSVMRGISLKHLCAVNEKDYDKVVAVSDDSGGFVQIDESGLYLGKPMLKYWESGEVDFDCPAREKILRSVEYSTKSGYTLGIIYGKERREFYLSPRENFKSLNVKGKEFKFYIKSDNYSDEIYPPIFVADILR